MDKALREHIRIMEIKLQEWKKSLKNASGEERQQIKKDIRRTYRHHVVKTHDFQHERLIHLIVTLFFGILFLFSLAALFAIQMIDLPFITAVTVLDLVLVVLLLVTELLYIRHYYFLENGVQKLYGITDKIVLLIGN